jgi:hypothetical protein
LGERVRIMILTPRYPIFYTAFLLHFHWVQRSSVRWSQTHWGGGFPSAFRDHMQGNELGTGTKPVMPYFKVRPTRMETGGTGIGGMTSLWKVHDRLRWIILDLSVTCSVYATFLDWFTSVSRRFVVIILTLFLPILPILCIRIWGRHSSHSVSWKTGPGDEILHALQPHNHIGCVIFVIPMIIHFLNTLVPRYTSLIRSRSLDLYQTVRVPNEIFP